MTQKTVEIGYWRKSKKRKRKSDYPWPKVKGTPDQDFITKAVKVQANGHALGIKIVMYRGLSWSRLDGKMLGCSEFQIVSQSGVLYLWPWDYVSHYLKAGVKPDPIFVKMINHLYKQL